MVKKFSFDVIPFTVKDLHFIKLPEKIGREINGKNVKITIEIENLREFQPTPEDMRKLNILDELKKWLMKLASEEPDTSITPRTVALNFKITENDAVKYLSILEVDDIIKSDDSKGYLIYRVRKK